MDVNGASTNVAGNGLAHEQLAAGKTVDGFEPVDEFDVSKQTTVSVGEAEGVAQLDTTLLPLKASLDEEMHANGVAADETEVALESTATKVEGEDDERPQEEKWKQRLWFVRVPKPPEDTAIKALEQEFESVRAQVKLLTESLNLKRMEKDAAFSNTKGAREAFANCQNQLNQKDEELKPLKELKVKSRDLAAELKTKYGDLVVKTEAELDKMVQDIEHQIQHDSLSLNEEKKLLQTSKKLRSQRDKVKEYAVKANVLEELRAQIRKLEGDMNIHELEKKALLSEKQVQQQIRNKYVEEEKAIESDIQQVVEERKVVRETLNAVFEKLQQRREENRTKLDDFYKNRAFSRRVRELVAEKKLEEARDLCLQQLEEMHSKFASDEQYRVEYFRLWEQLRKPSFFFGDDDAELDVVEVKDRKGGKSKEKTDRSKPVPPTKATPEDIINAALAEVGQPPQPAVAAEQPPPPTPEAKPAKVVKKPKPAPKTLVEQIALPPEQEDKFTLPDFVKPTASEADKTDKDKERQHNAAAAAEAEKRKERRKKAADQRRQKMMEQAKAKEEEAKAKPTDETVAEYVVDEDQVTVEKQEAVSQPPASASAPPAAAPKAGSRHHAVVQPVRATKRPPIKKKGLKSLWKQLEMYIIAAVFVIFVATIVHIVLSK